MSLITKTFEHKKPFVGYVTVGHGGLERSYDMACAFIDGGADILEVGVPFSDPVADGPVIQRAMTDALNHGVTLNDVFEFSARLKKQYPHVPLVLFGYYNVFFQAMNNDFFAKVKNAGFDGILVVDLPYDEGEAFHESCRHAGLDQIFLITPSTREDRLAAILTKASGFLYYVSRKGTTGARDSLPADLNQNIQRIRSKTSLPVVVGFGLSNRQMVEEVLSQADGFVVASKIIERIETGASAEDIKQLVAEFAGEKA